MTDTDKNKEEQSPNLDVCTRAPEFAEHARPNESPQDACDDGRAGPSENDQSSESGR